MRLTGLTLSSSVVFLCRQQLIFAPSFWNRRASIGDLAWITPGNDDLFIEACCDVVEACCDVVKLT